MKRTVVFLMVIALTIGAQAATFTVGYTAGDLGPDMITDGALSTTSENATDLRANDSATGAGQYWWLTVWDDLWNVGDQVEITGIALSSVRSPNTNDTSNNTSNGIFTFTFYELNGGTANVWDGTDNGETVLGMAQVEFVNEGAGSHIVIYALFDSPVSFTAQSTGIAVHVNSTSSIRVRRTDLNDPVMGEGEKMALTAGDDQTGTMKWSLSGTINTPLIPSVTNPTPSDAEEYVDPTEVMTWDVINATNPTFDINIGTDTDCNDVLSGHNTDSNMSYTPSGDLFDYATEYFWGVDITDGGTEYPGTVWSFKTGGKAVNPVPASDNTVNMYSVNQLSFSGDALIDSYDIWFGSPGSLQFITNKSETNVSFSEIETALGKSPLPDGEYQWRVDTRDDANDLMVTGDIWDIRLVNVAVSDKPNVLYILADDLGYSDISAQGWVDLEFSTPHIDSIFTSGARFSQAYVSNSVCAPSRAGLLTGRSGSRFGFEANIPHNYASQPGSRIGLDPNQKTIADILKTVGYKTYAIGKWHLGDNHDLFHPNIRGFDEFYGLIGGSRTYFQLSTFVDDKSILHNSTWVQEPVDMYITDFLTDQAINYITDQTTNNPGQPWFMYMSYTAPHGPMEAKPEDIARVPLVSHFTEASDNEKRQIYGAMVLSMDDNVGRLLTLLDTLGIANNTIVIFHSDNGGPLKGQNWSFNKPLRGKKGELWEGGVCVPLAISWPGTIPAGQVFDNDDFITSLDIMPTLAAVTGADQINEIKTDGINIMPLLTNEISSLSSRKLYWRRGTAMKTGYRSGDYKYLINRNTSTEYLFDIANSCEWDTCNKINSEPVIAAQMASEWDDYEATIPDPHWNGDGYLLAITTYDLDNAIRNKPYSMSLTHSTPDGGAATWSISSGKPDWLSIDPNTGLLSGTPDQLADSYNYIRLQIDYAGDTSIYNAPLLVKEQGDLNDDGKVDMNDVAKLGSQWQNGYDINTLQDIATNWLYG